MFTSLLLLLLGAQPSHAFPQVGDFTEVKIITKYQGTVEEITEHNELVSFNSATQEFLLVKTIRRPGQPPRPWKFLVSLPMFLREQASARDLVANCAEHGGRSEVLTIGTRAVPTCRMDHGGRPKVEIWHTPEMLWNEALKLETESGYSRETAVVDFK